MISLDLYNKNNYYTPCRYVSDTTNALKALYERIGILNYDDKIYQDDLNKIADKLYSIATTDTDKDYIERYLNDDTLPEYNGNYAEVRFSNICNIDDLFILINTAPVGQEDCVSLTKKEFERRYYVLNGCKTNKLTIIYLFPFYSTSKEHIASVIEHELKHVFDQNKKYKNSLENMNKDIIFRDNVFLKFVQNALDTSGMPLTMGIGNFYDIHKLNSFYKSHYYNNQFVMWAVLYDFLYYCNESEMSARLTLVKWNEDIDDSKRRYNLYLKLIDNIDVYATDNVKQYLNTIITGLHFEKIYNIKFNKNEYKLNVQKLFNFYRKRITHFIKQADKVIYDNKIKNESKVWVHTKVRLSPINMQYKSLW